MGQLVWMWIHTERYLIYSNFKKYQYITSFLTSKKHYDCVVNAKQFANHVVPSTVSVNELYKTNLTTPGTHEHQDLLQKYGIAWVFNKINGGSWVLTSPDMILQHERKGYMKPWMKMMEGKKKVITNCSWVSNGICCLFVLFLENICHTLLSILYFYTYQYRKLS